MERAGKPGQSDKDELTLLVERYADSLLRTCYVYLKVRAQAEDAVQEAFLRAWEHRALLRTLNEYQRKAWLMRTAIRLCHDIYRSQWFRHVSRRLTLDDLPPHLMEVQPEDQTLLLSICNLPEKHKQIILLYYYQGIAMREIGEILGISAAAVLKRLRRAQALLKVELEGREF